MDKPDCTEQDLSSLRAIALLSLHLKIRTLLHARGVLRTQNHPVDDEARWRVANMNRGLGIFTLEKILASERVDDSVKSQARNLIRRYGYICYRPTTWNSANANVSQSASPDSPVFVFHLSGYGKRAS
ncbi:hypothetical protein POH93_24425 [Phytobacter diazotrophicus]|uniref:hypothetical protein n=1 Tax=Phytobacter diazotrophicus TaxID=395631 RepID=UPI00232CB031|nr:hypothetical protein [Phytobacter diazotrophicus]MDC0728513.1 hypothetical protein [Phytobacter diazotrophicus]MDC0735727.1 hypothetical protein [Phytobacter diazotrophicus]